MGDSQAEARETREPTAVELTQAKLLALQIAEGSGMPAEAMAILHPLIRDGVLVGMDTERRRCLNVVEALHSLLAAGKNQLEGSLQLAILNDNTGLISELSQKRMKADGGLIELQRAVYSLSIPPGSCEKCGGSRQVQSAIMVNAGRPVLVPYPACCP